ncbi:MAG: restriction endonuclease subunit S [Prevotella sp.]|jgi:type I restriction enzyme S subunit|nr:restriction endonuclease subunit S [Prevotella sp.]MCI2081193.1 restriction endonuclease subunit S [Prevotella sp.]MCI2103050.1 restriction endonuclease subunit S [Prevotella sp.]
MKEYKLSELIKIKNGKDHKSLPDGNYPVFGSGGIMRYANQYLYDKPSILLPRKGSLSSIQFYDKPFWTVDTLFYTEVNEKLVSPYYLYLYLTQLNLSGLDTGTGVPSMTSSSYYSIKVQLPNIDDQIQKASLIRKIDDKIALNRQINDNLEAIARQLYDYWFVQFDFPDENGRPYKSNGGKMVWNKKLKREIPKGWYASNIGKVADILSGGTPSKAIPEYWDKGTIPFFGPTDCNGNTFQLQTKDHITEDGLKHCASSLYEEGVIFITARGSIGKLVIVGTPMAMNQSCYALKSKTGEYEYLFFLTLQLIEWLKAKGNGSVFKSIISSDIEESALCIGGEDIIALYCKSVKPIFEKIKSNSQEIINLIKQRDKLLPLLMNGQVSV